LFKGLEKEYVMSLNELVDNGNSIVCVYKSPDSKFWTFFKIQDLSI